MLKEKKYSLETELIKGWKSCPLGYLLTRRIWLLEDQEFQLGCVELNLRCLISLSNGSTWLGVGYMSVEFGGGVELSWIVRYCQYRADIKTNYVKGTNGSNKPRTDNQPLV